jgi:hypothetical protein
MVNLNDLNMLEVLLTEHCYNMGILKKGANKKKVDALIDSLMISFIRCEMSLDSVKELLLDIREDNVFDLDFFKKGGNVWSYIKPNWVKIAKRIWRQRSVGLGTPNSASGEGELMFLFLSPKIKKPAKGDLLVGGIIVELKGQNIRIDGNIIGKIFRTSTLEVCLKYNLTPNISNKSNLKSVEIEKKSHENHWMNELRKLNILEQKNFILDYLRCIDPEFNDIDWVFKPEFSFIELKNSIVKILYKVMSLERKFNTFIILDDGNNAKIFSDNIEHFNENVDNGNIKIGKDYFRINQNANIGWYIS